MRERNKKRLQRKHAKSPAEEQDFMANVKGGRLTKSDYDVEMSKFKKNEDIIMEVMMEVDGDGEYERSFGRDSFTASAPAIAPLVDLIATQNFAT